MGLTKIDDRGLKTPIDLLDNEKIRLGTGNDLEIYHTGAHTYIENSTGSWVNRNTGGAYTIDIAGDFHIRNQDNSETRLRANNNGAVELYYDNSKKLETISSGLRVHGSNAYIGNSGENLRLHHNNNDSYIDSNVGNLYLRTTTSGVNALIAYTNAQVELYHANSKKFETTNLGAQITGELSLTTHLKLLDDQKVVCGNGEDLQIYHNGTDSYLNNSTGDLYIKTTGSGSDDINIIANDDVEIKTNSGDLSIKAVGGAGTNLYYNGSQKFETTSTGNNLRGSLQLCEGHFRPYNNNTWDLGTTGDRWRNIYTNDLHLSNEGSSNNVDGTWGDWTIQEGESDLFLKNNRSGKQYKFNLTEVS